MTYPTLAARLCDDDCLCAVHDECTEACNPVTICGDCGHDCGDADLAEACCTMQTRCDCCAPQEPEYEKDLDRWSAYQREQAR